MTLTLRLSTASTEAMPSNELSLVHPVSPSTQYRQVNTTSSAVKSLPSDHLSPSFNFHVIDIRSSAKPPFSCVGISAASADTRLPSGSYLAKGSSVTAPASRSLKPPDRYGLGREGACQ